MSSYFSGFFEKGEINKPTPVHTQKEFKLLFGRANNENYNDWYQAFNYLAYASDLIVTRSVGSDVMNSYGSYPAPDIPTLIYNYDDFLSKQSTIALVPGNSLKVIARTPGSWGNILSVAIISMKEWEKDVTIIKNFTAKDLVKEFSPDEYAVFIIRNNQLVETFIKPYDNLSEINAESDYIYIISDITSPRRYIDGNVALYDGNFYIYDGNEEYYQSLPIVYGDNIMRMDNGYENAPSAGELSESYGLIASVEEYEIDLIIGNERNNQAAIDLAESRGDSIAVIGTDFGTDVQEYRSFFGNSEFSTFIGEYKRQYDPFSNTDRWVNFAGDVAGLKSKSDKEYNEWVAAAGLSRGKIQNCIDIKHKFTAMKQDELQRIGINTIAFQDGYYLKGQKLLTYKPAMIDQVNVKALFNKIKRDIAKKARLGVFEHNDNYTRTRLVSEIKPYLSYIKADRGISNYKIICDETNNKSSDTIVIDIFVQPITAIEIIRIRFTNTGSSSIAEVSSRSTAPMTQKIHTISSKPYLPPSTVPLDAILQETGDLIFTESGDYLAI